MYNLRSSHDSCNGDNVFVTAYYYVGDKTSCCFIFGLTFFGSLIRLSYGIFTAKSDDMFVRTVIIKWSVSNENNKKKTVV